MNILFLESSLLLCIVRLYFKYVNASCTVAYRNVIYDSDERGAVHLTMVPFKTPVCYSNNWCFKIL